jgi:hypothetical protein
LPPVIGCRVKVLIELSAGSASIINKKSLVFPPLAVPLSGWEFSIRDYLNMNLNPWPVARASSIEFVARLSRTVGAWRLGPENLGLRSRCSLRPRLAYDGPLALEACDKLKRNCSNTAGSSFP